MTKKTIIFGTGHETERKIFNEKKFSKIIDFCIDKKICNFDTSDNYFNGKIEKILGSRIKKSSNKIKILNKFRLINDIEILKKNLDNSLKNLNKDYIDLYMPHWPIFNFDKNLLSDFANESIENGKIKKFGLSNFSLLMIKDFRKIFKKNISLQFELNFSNFFFNKDLLKYCYNNKIDTYCFSIAHNFPSKDKYLRNIKLENNLNNYEVSLKWLSNYKFINPIIRSSKKKNILKNIKIYKGKKIKIDEKKINSKKFYANININKIKKIQSGSGVIYKNVSEAIKNKYKIYPSPLDISLEIKKYGLLKPFVFKKNKKFYSLISGQARFWGLLIGNKKIRQIKGLLID